MQRLETVDSLRGIAALAVVCCHAIHGPVSAVTDYGGLGVFVFFVVSGCVIPFSLLRSGYMLRQYPRFVARRMVRLDPPYLVSIALAIGLHYVSYWTPGFRGAPPHYTAAQILLHLGYLNSFAHSTWILPVYWTLGIEFQYYLAVGLLFPLLCSRSVWCEPVLLAIAGVADGFAHGFPIYAKLDQAPLIGHYAFVFTLGFLVFRRRAGLIGRARYMICCPIAAAGVAGACGPVIAVVALLTALTISELSLAARPLVWLGGISYSLYLFHYLIVGRVIGIGARLNWNPLVTGVVGIAGSILAAWALAHWIEEPAKRLAARISLHPTLKRSVVVA